MTTSIFIRSYAGDFEWLKYALRSIQKFCSGFGQTVIVIPEEDEAALKAFGLTREIVYAVPQIGKDGYLVQQVDKLNADRYCSSDLILYFDSDCVFTEPATPESFMRDGKPEMLITPYSTLPPDFPWRKVTERALGFPCEFETMRRIPLIFPADLLHSIRGYFESHHGKTLANYIMTRPYREFSEFNVMGAWSLKFAPDRIRWLDTTKEELPRKVATQFWSWGGITPEVRVQLEEAVK